MTPRTTPEHLAYAIAQDANSIGWQELYQRVSDVIHAHGEACYTAGYQDGQLSVKPTNDVCSHNDVYLDSKGQVWCSNENCRVKVTSASRTVGVKPKPRKRG